MLNDRRANVSEHASECDISNGRVYTIIDGQYGYKTPEAQRAKPEEFNTHNIKLNLASLLGSRY